jgi:hypothetical protein
VIEKTFLVVKLDDCPKLRAGIYNNLTSKQATPFLINDAVDALIAQGYPKRIEHEILYHHSYVEWGTYRVKLCMSAFDNDAKE